MNFKRTKILIALSFSFFLLLMVRVGYIWVENGKSYEAMALNQQKRQVTIKKIRGTIEDRNGVPFTDSVKQKMYLTKYGKISLQNKDSKYAFETERRIPDIAKHIIGYTNGDGNGICGIEKTYNSLIKNQGSINLSYMADAVGTPVNSFVLNTCKKPDNSRVCLTIDREIQKIAENVMNKHVKKGAAVILDCRTFDVLAMVSRPDYKPEQFEQYKNSCDGELLNRALMGYNAGSVFKIVTASTALEKNSLYVDRFFECHGRYDLKDEGHFACNENKGHGILSFDDAFALSCNCCFYLTGLECGGRAIADMASEFGVGSKLLNVALEENSGNIPQKESYFKREVLNLSIGQGEILITPLQCAVMAGVVANNGLRRDVNIVSGYYKEDGNYHNVKKEKSYRVIRQSTALMVSQMMRECVMHGTAKEAFKSKVSIAGKTGSAESGWVKNGTSMVHGWFCGFFPHESPKYAMAILCEDGKSGAASCVTPFVEIAEKINEIYPYKQ